MANVTSEKITSESAAFGSAQRFGRRARSARSGSASVRGMTLIEILVVLVLLGVVMGIVSQNFLGKSDEAKSKAAKIEINQIGQALDLFKLEVGRYPTTQEGLQALLAAPSGVVNWSGPYWKTAKLPTDPWQREYKYTSPGTNNKVYEIVSLGADGKEGGEGPNRDVSNE